MYKSAFYSPALYCLITLLIVLTGCGNDPEPRAALAFASGMNLTTTDKKVTAGEMISTSIYARTPSSNKFKNFKILYSYDSTEFITYLDSTLNSDTYGMYFTFAPRGITGTETWTFEITDDQNKTYSRKYTLTTSGNANTDFNTYSSYFYHKSALENLQYFAATDGTAYPGYAARNNTAIKPKVNLYFEQQSHRIVNLASPAFTNTTFKTTNLTPANFNAVDANALATAYDNSTDEIVNQVPALKKNQVIAFKTAQNKVGLIQISAFEKVLDREQNDSVLIRMRYNVKVQKP